MSVYELFNAVSGLNIPISGENEEEFLTEVGSHADVGGSGPELVFGLVTASCVTDRGAGEEERGPRPETEKENLSCGIGGQRPASRARRRRLTAALGSLALCLNTEGAPGASLSNPASTHAPHPLTASRRAAAPPPGCRSHSDGGRRAF